MKKLSLDGTGVVGEVRMREIRTVCAWELFVLSKTKSFPPRDGEWRMENGESRVESRYGGKRDGERWKSTRETLQHCTSLIASH